MAMSVRASGLLLALCLLPALGSAQEKEPSTIHDYSLNANRDLVFEHDAQFFAYAARAMRHLLCDRARNQLRLCAGGDWLRVTLTGSDDALAFDVAGQALALDAALDRLAQADARAARVVELRYFAGLTLEQTAQILGLTRRTVDRDWRFARAFLKSEIE